MLSELEREAYLLTAFSTIERAQACMVFEAAFCTFRRHHTLPRSMAIYDLRVGKSSAWAECSSHWNQAGMLASRRREPSTHAPQV